MRTIPVLFLAACAATPDADPFDAGGGAIESALAEAAPLADDTLAPRAPLILVADPLVQGQSATLQVSGLAPGETTYLAYSLYGTGNGICPPAMGGQCLNLLSPVQLLATPTADASGVATFTANVPAATPAGLQVSFQAVAIRGIGGAQTVKSPAVTEVVQAAPAGDDFVHQPASVDLLFVIDNSCSMFEEQQNLAASFPAMLGIFGSLDLSVHVGVVTTDMDDPAQSGKLRPDGQGRLWIDDQTPNPGASFQVMANQGTLGSATEQGLEAMTASLNAQAGYNAGFRRVDAQYAVVVVSDEDDQSRHVTPQQAAAVMVGQQSHSGDSTFSSIVTPQAGCVPNGVSPGTSYLQVTALVNGATESICAPDYSNALDDLTQMWWTSEPYVLSAVPANPAAIAVTVDGVAVAASDFVYDAAENSVRFTNGFAPIAGAAVHVDY